VTEQMLENMFIGKPPGNTDRILDFSTAVTGCLFFAPCADFLDDPPGPPGSRRACRCSPASAGPDGSLGIGSSRASRDPGQHPLKGER
jgi:putative iron-dependent peroxidase